MIITNLPTFGGGGKINSLLSENLVIGTSDKWSEWVTPENKENYSQPQFAITYLPSGKKAGDKYTCSVEIEFSGVTKGTGSFKFALQGAVDDGWSKTNVWNSNDAHVSLTEPPKDGIYKFTWVSSLQQNAVDSTKHACGFRADYWGGGKFRWRNVKVECGSNPNPIWTPAPADVILTKSDLKAFLDEYYAEKK